MKARMAVVLQLRGYWCAAGPSCEIYASHVCATEIAVYILHERLDLGSSKLSASLQLKNSERPELPGFALRATSFNAIAHYPELPFGVNTFVCTRVRDSHRQPHMTYPTVKHLLCKALIKASGGRIDKPFLKTAA